MAQVKMDTLQDLGAFINQLPLEDRWKALGILGDVSWGKVTPEEATEMLKHLFINAGLAYEEVQP